jgi:hypothetical protein
VKWWTQMRFFRIWGTHKVTCKWNLFLGVGKAKEPIWVTIKPVPSPRRTSSVLSYSEWMDMFYRSPVILWEAAKSINHLFSWPSEVLAQLAVILEDLSFGQVFAVWPIWSQYWHFGWKRLWFEVGWLELLLRRWSRDGPFKERCWPCWHEGLFPLLLPLGCWVVGKPEWWLVKFAAATSYYVAAFILLKISYSNRSGDLMEFETQPLEDI